MMKYLPFLLFLLLKAGTATAQNNLVVNGIPWFDDKGNIVNAHGACIVEENGVSGFSWLVSFLLSV